MSRPSTARTERVSIQTLRDRSARVAELRAKLAALVEDERRALDDDPKPAGETGRGNGIDDRPAAWRPSPEDHLAASFPPDLPSKIKVRSQALHNTLQALSHASSKIKASSTALQGDTRIQNLVAQVEARRALAFAELSRLFRVESQDQDATTRITQDITALNIDNQWSGLGPDISSPTVSQETSGKHGRSAGRATVPAKAIHDGSIARSDAAVPRVTISGCAIDPSTWQRAFDDDGYDASDISPETDRETAIALCYAAEIVSIASTIVDVPLRYPITLRGTHSIIADAEANVPGRRTFPLFIDSTKDGRAKFAIAVFLLNKNINQLTSYLHIPITPDRPETNKDLIGIALMRLLSGCATMTP